MQQSTHFRSYLALSEKQIRITDWSLRCVAMGAHKNFCVNLVRCWILIDQRVTTLIAGHVGLDAELARRLRVRATM